MIWVHERHFSGYFGNAADNLHAQDSLQYDQNNFKRLLEKLKAQYPQLEALFFLKQTHSADVCVIDDVDIVQQPLSLFERMGDAIITQQKNVGIGVATADCLPIFLYDPICDAIAVIHAGWRGLQQQIITKTIQKMCAAFGAQPSNIQAFLGPSAGVCCYEVQSDLVDCFARSVFADKIVEKRDKKLFFNGCQAAVTELIKSGVLMRSVVSHHHCTICVPGYCSYRKEKQQSGRQPSVAYLFDT